MGFVLRASVASVCNMECMYCPRECMEDFSPQGLEAPNLSNNDYIKVITNLLQSEPFPRVSLTGGEPLLNENLVDIAKAIRPHVQQLEITTNGTLLTYDRWQELQPYFDRVKVSLDTVDSEKFKEITGHKKTGGLEKIQNAIRLVRDSGSDVAINCVAMNSTVDGLNDVINWAKNERVRLHLLDLYHTKETNDIWEKEFIPLETVMEVAQINEQYGPPAQDKFGCVFLTFNFDEAPSVLRLKTTFSGTKRGERCDDCDDYCQEGMYGLKLSMKGWVTPCPSGEKARGTILMPEWNVEQTQIAVDDIVEELLTAERNPDSFETFVERNGVSYLAQG